MYKSKMNVSCFDNKVVKIENSIQPYSMSRFIFHQYLRNINETTHVFSKLTIEIESSWEKFDISFTFDILSSGGLTRSYRGL